MGAGESVDVDRGRPSCFIMMPVSTPERMVSDYSGDTDHFFHVLEHLIIPSVARAGFDPLLPTMKGSVVIQAEIIRRLCTADMAVCDMSGLNANVFFEMGIRTAINRPMAVIRDNLSLAVPFDTSIINYHVYSASVSAWEAEAQISSLSRHIEETFVASTGKNAMWSAFGVEGEWPSRPPHPNSAADELSAIRKEVEHIRRLQVTSPGRRDGAGRANVTPAEVFSILSDIAVDAGYYIDVGHASLHRIEIKMKRNRPLPIEFRKILEKAAWRYGYKLAFAF